MSSASFITGGGETGGIIRSLDWSTTLLGGAHAWPQSLRTAINICVGSRFPIALYWGREFVMIYNDGLKPMVGANKHPQAMGRPAFEVLPEIRAIIEPMLLHVITTGEATWSENLMLPLAREAGPDESYFTFTYSPLNDEAGNVGGVFCAVVETTEQVIEGRRLRLLNSLAEATQERTMKAAATRAAAQIALAPNDVPFALLYLLDADERSATLAGASNIEMGSEYAPTTITIGASSRWPFDPTHASESKVIDLANGPSGARAAAILAIDRSGGGKPIGFVVVGLSPMLAKTASYDRFHTLLASSISQAVGNAAAYEEERARAEALTELDRAKTTFFSNVSHEFRTPLTLMLAPIQDMLALPDGASVDRAELARAVQVAS